VPPRESPTSNPELASRYPLALVSPPAHHLTSQELADLGGEATFCDVLVEVAPA
jgi:hypothetical protein